MSGKLTVEQVRKVIFNSSNCATYDGTKFHASGIDVQVIADELNKTLNSEVLVDEPMKHGCRYYDTEQHCCILPGDPLEHGWMRLPLDADGITIYLGDTLECDNKQFVVEGYVSELPEGHGELFVIDDEDNQWDCSECHHAKTDIMTCSMKPTFINPVTLNAMQEYTCSECKEFTYSLGKELPKFCSNCGRKVAEA